jgi:hypothetical protein
MEGTTRPYQTHRDDGEQELVTGPDGRPVRVSRPGPGDDERDDAEQQGGEAIEEPAKIMRLGSMIKQLLEEVRAAPLDEPSRNRLREIHANSIAELEKGLSPELRAELNRVALPFSKEVTPSDAELRIAHAQLVGWLEGLFHGIQAALFAQQMAARAQLEQMRRGLPPGMAGTPVPPGMIGPPMPRAPEGPRGTGQYL